MTDEEDNEIFGQAKENVERETKRYKRFIVTIIALALVCLGVLAYELLIPMVS